MYKLYRTSSEQSEFNAVMTVGVNPQISFIFDPANTDYANFKAQILADEAQLQDAAGSLMTPQDAKDFVRTLP